MRIEITKERKWLRQRKRYLIYPQLHSSCSYSYYYREPLIIIPTREPRGAKEAKRTLGHETTRGHGEGTLGRASYEDTKADSLAPILYLPPSITAWPSPRIDHRLCAGVSDTRNHPTTPPLFSYKLPHCRHSCPLLLFHDLDVNLATGFVSLTRSHCSSVLVFNGSSLTRI